MSQDFFDVEKGYQLDEGTVRLQGTGAPGAAGDSSLVVVGSYYTDLTSGAMYTKITAGVGTDKWRVLATEEFVLANAGGSTDWKESVRLATDAALPAYTAAGSGLGKTLTADAFGILTVDGVAPALNDRILVKDEAASHIDHGVYTLTIVGTAGVAFELTRATDSDQDAEMTSGHTMAVEEGTNNGDEYWQCITNDPIVVDTTAMQYIKVSDAETIQELADIRAFIGKSGPGVIATDFNTPYVVNNGDDLETAIAKLDKHAEDARTINQSAAITAVTTVDSVLCDVVLAVKWIVHIRDNVTPANVKVVEIMATHDGHSGADATDSDYTTYAKLKMGANIGGLTIDVTVTGAAGAQALNLRIASSTGIIARTTREVILEVNTVP